jgi:MFS family permease
MSSLASAPGARRLLVISLLARLPLVMLSLGLLVHTQRLTGSFATAGAVTGAYAVALAVGGPLLGRLVDGRGQRVVLLASAGAAALLLAAIAALPPGAAPAVLLALAAGIGFATPPIGACLRSLLPRLLPDAGAVRAAYALDASASELTWIAGPPLALGLGALWSTGAALALAGLGLFCATAAFAWQPASRGWRPAAGDAPRPRGGSLGSPAMRTLVLVLIAVGVLFGAVEVAVTAVAKLDGGSTAAAAPLLALWGAGSLAGGAVSARFGTPGLVPLLAALAAGHLALVAVGSLAALGAVLFVAGTAIAPTYSAVYAMVDDAAPAGTVTEAFAWLATAIGIGAAIGAAAAGALADHTGPEAAFVLAGAAGAVALLTTLLRARTLPAREVAVLPVAVPAT